jgi:hypothetical protein
MLKKTFIFPCSFFALTYISKKYILVFHDIFIFYVRQKCYNFTNTCSHNNYINLYPIKFITIYNELLPSDEVNNIQLFNAYEGNRPEYFAQGIRNQPMAEGNRTLGGF